MRDYFELAKSLARAEGERVMSKANEPAYPATTYQWDANYGGREEIFWPGLTKREVYALAAMHGIIASGKTFDPYTNGDLAIRAFKIADAMVKESEKDNEK